MWSWGIKAMQNFDVRDILTRRGPFDPKAALDAVNAVVRASVGIYDAERAIDGGSHEAWADLEKVWNEFDAAIAALKEVMK
jgi:hypothetical protein